MQMPKEGEPIWPLMVEYRFEQMRETDAAKAVTRTCSSAAHVRIEAARSVGGAVLREITRAMAISGFVGRTVIGMDALDWNDGGKRIRRRFVPCEPCVKARSRPSTHEPWL